MDVATQGALNFALLVVFVGTGFLLVVVFARSSGTRSPARRAGGSLLYLLASPVPTRHFSAWIGLLGDPPDTADMVWGTCFALEYAVVLLAITYRGLQRKDVVS